MEGGRKEKKQETKEIMKEKKKREDRKREGRKERGRGKKKKKKGNETKKKKAFSKIKPTLLDRVRLQVRPYFENNKQQDLADHF